MEQVIIYSNPEGCLCTVMPTSEALKTMTIEDIAKKDVPAGIEYKIVNVADLPQDITFYEAWEYQE